MATSGLAPPKADPQAQLNETLKQDADGRVPVHSFDPDSSPSQKGAAAGTDRDQLKSIIAQPESGGQEVHVYNGASNGPVPTITINDHDATKSKDTNKISSKVDSGDAPPVPGALPAARARPIPDWFKVGWRSASGIDAPPLTEGEEKEKSVLDVFLSEQFYGSWYHNAALIVFAVFTSHFLTRFHFGWGWLFILLAFCNTYYSTSMQRFRRRARDDIQRNLVKTRLLSEHESADWINNFLDRFWLIYEPVLSTTIISSVDQILSSNTPPFLDSLRLSTFTLGTKAPRIDQVRTFPKTDDDIVMMDWGISFTPNDISDLTPKQAALKVNPKIVLSVRVGTGVATAAMPILLEDISFTGLMRIRMKLMSNFPHIQVVDISFLEKPVIDYVLKPVGGETFGFDIANIPGLSSFIRDMTHATLGPILYDPNYFVLNLEQLLSGAPLDAAVGVLLITIQSARGLQGVKMGGGTPDPYVSININHRAELACTKYKHDTHNPTWMETKFLLLNSLSESLILNVFDFNDHRKNTLLSTATFELSKLQDDATQEGIQLPLLKDGKVKGELRFDCSYYPILTPQEGQKEVDSTVGIVRLTVHQAKDLDVSKSLSGDLNPLAKVFLNSRTIHATKRFKHTNHPVWESSYEFLCSDKTSSVIAVKVLDDREFLKDPVIGYMSIKLEDLLEFNKEAARDWFPLSGCKTGKLRLTAEWKPLSMAGSLHGADQYRPPIGVVRLLLEKATDVKNVEAALGGKSDPYVRVLVNNTIKGRTEVINNNLNPVWDQIIYVPVHSLKETMLLECMDYQHLTKDRSLGSVELRVAKLAKESDNNRFPFESTGTETAIEPLRLDKGGAFKGDLHYTAEFVPALAIKGVKFAVQSNEIQRAAEGQEDEDGYVVESPAFDDDQQGLEGVTIQNLKKTRMAEVKSTDSTNTVDTANVANSNHTADSIHTAEINATHETKTEKIPDEGVEMTTEEVLAQQSGIIVFNVLSGTLTKKARLEVLLDDGYWPCFSTVKSRSTQAKWEYIGEGFIKELDFGQVWLRLNEAVEGEREDIIGEWKGDAKAFLQSTLEGPQKFTLRDENDRTSTIEIETRYVPVPVKLEARESINNQGLLRVDLLDGREIRGVDRGGKSDPFAVFTLNGQKVFKSQTKKKTLNPEWNENFNVSVPSRVGADFSVEIFDWNQIEAAKTLGTAKIELADLEPFQAAERNLHLSSSKYGEKGQIRVRLMFQPEIIAKSRKPTSTFSTAGRAMTQLGGLPVNAGKGVLSGVTGVFKKGHKDDDSLPSGLDVALGQVAPEQVAAGQASHPVAPSNGMEGIGATPPSTNQKTSVGPTPSAPRDPGTLKVTILSAKDMTTSDIKPYATIRVGDKEFKTRHASKTTSPEWNETFTFVAGALTPKLFVWIHDHKTIGKDKLLGDAEVDIWRHVQPEGTSAADVSVELREGHGLLHMRLEYDAHTNPLDSRSSSSNDLGMSRTTSIPSPSRFSIRGRRPMPFQDES